MGNLNFNRSAIGIESFTGNEITDFAGESCSVTIKNKGTSAVKRAIAISPGFAQNASDIKTRLGAACDAIIADGEIIDVTDKEVEVSSDDSIVANLVNTFVHLPMQITGLKVQTDDSSQMAQAIEFIKMTPQSNISVHTVIPNKAKTQGDNDDKRADIPLASRGLVTGQDMAIVANVAPGRELTITFYYANKMSYRSQLEYLVNTGTL